MDSHYTTLGRDMDTFSQFGGDDSLRSSLWSSGKSDHATGAFAMCTM